MLLSFNFYFCVKFRLFGCIWLVVCFAWLLDVVLVWLVFLASWLLFLLSDLGMVDDFWYGGLWLLL